MKFSKITVNNYRALKEVTVPLSNFGCLIGENNAGKSSVLQCISLFKSGTKLKDTDHYDTSKEISIAITFTDITDADLQRVTTQEHRERFQALIEEGCIEIMRLYEVGGESSKYVIAKMLPTDERFTPDNVQSLITGRRGADLRQSITSVFPELDSALPASPTQAAVKDQINTLIDSLPAEQKQKSYIPLPTGLDKSLSPFLPEVIYIPAVKDVSDDIKTTETASFGKLLKILFDEISHEFTDIQDQFVNLQRKLSRIVDDEGNVTDDRLDQVKKIEETIEKYVKDNFPQVQLRLNVPAPELKTVLSNAELTADDGFEGPITSKGDGLKRAVAFAILRAYAEIRKSGLTQDTGERATDPQHSYYLLFEEPELYLHPKAQRQLFQALSTFSKEHNVLLTTHSPVFFQPGYTHTFSKLKKIDAGNSSPFTTVYPIDLSDINSKNQFQLITYENNNIAFFSDCVVLVEGDSDFISLPYISRLINPEWDSEVCPVSFARISGKSSVARYKDFFGRFGIRVTVVCDLDAITDGFSKLLPSDEAKEIHGRLMQKLDDLLPAESEAQSTRLRSMARSGAAREAWNAAIQAKQEWEQDPSAWNTLASSIEDFFGIARMDAKTALLANAEDESLKTIKQELFLKLADEDIFILSRGAIEDYYPQISGSDKIERAMNFCNTCTSTTGLNGGFDETHHPLPATEFEQIFNKIFS